MSRSIVQPRRHRTSGAAPPLLEEIPWPEALPELFRSVASLPGAIFFDSARQDAKLARYSFMAADPFATVRSRRGCVQVRGPGGRRQECGHADPIDWLADELDQFTAPALPGVPPFQGGAAGVFSYDLCHHFERLPRPRVDEFEIADLVLGLYDWTLALDHVDRRAWLISTGFPQLTSRARRRRAMERARRVRALIAADGRDGRSDCRAADIGARLAAATKQLDATSLVPQHALGRLPWPASNFTRHEYLRSVERAIEYIRAGDVYQVNLAQRLTAPSSDSPAELYLRLRDQNPAPFAGYFDAGDFVIASASPERFLRIQDRAVETRPIKGTRPRWPLPEADMSAGLELIESAKDRAENVMIVDLLRNDLGRVCEFGSISVQDPLRLESYQFVHHLVSEVRGRLRPECGPLDLLRAAFPGGSVTGAPKIRAMEIIAELEPTARGPYCGSLGYIGFDGSMDTSILIRTFICSRGWVQFPVGGGIVADSSPEREFEETLHKAEGLIRALPWYSKG